VKICDFGLSRLDDLQGSVEKTRNIRGSPAYAAPELASSKHTNKVDVYSYAVM
jgi:serine/threonine protein kinase